MNCPGWFLFCVMKEVLMNLAFSTNGANRARFSDLPQPRFYCLGSCLPANWAAEHLSVLTANLLTQTIKDLFRWRRSHIHMSLLNELILSCTWKHVPWKTQYSLAVLSFCCLDLQLNFIKTIGAYMNENSFSEMIQTFWKRVCLP